MTLTLTYDNTLSRVVIEGTDLADGFARVERSVNQLLWMTVRGGVAVPIQNGTFTLYDYEFFDGVENFYRLVPAVDEAFTTAAENQESGDSWEVPTGVSGLTVQAWGAGGCGQGLNPPTSQRARAGGGGGAYARSTINTVPGETLLIRVGDGGKKFQAGSQGHDGNHSTVFRGDMVLVEARGGLGTIGSDVPGPGGSANASTGTVKFAGGTGGLREAINGAGGGGGGSAFSGNAGSVGGNGAAGVGGAGGAGEGPGGAGGDVILGVGQPGEKGFAPGGGGGGQGDIQDGSPSVPPPASGDGADGQILLHSWQGFPFTTTGMFLPGDTSSYAVTPDAAPLDIIGDIDLRAVVQLETWASGNVQEIIAKYETAPNQRSYLLRTNANGTLSLLWSTLGTATNGSVASTVPVPAGFNETIAIRATLDVDNGAAGNTVTFYIGTDINGPWTVLGAPVITAGVTNIFSGTSQLAVGARLNPPSSPLTGYVMQVQVRDGINGTVVANPDFEAQAPGTTVFVDSVGRTWTLAGDAEIVGPEQLSNSIIPELDEIWLKSIRYPFLNRPVECTNYENITRAFRGGIFPVQGRSMPIAVTDLRGSRQFQITVITQTLEQARDMDLILAANQVMFLHIPKEDPLTCGRVSAVPGGYVAIEPTTVQRRAFPGSSIYAWDLPCTEVVQPGPDIIGTTLTWGTVFNLYGSWEALIASNPTWIDLFQTVGSPEDLVIL